MTAEITVAINELERQIWRFWWSEREGVVLDEFFYERRASNRHKFRLVNFWLRISSRDSNIKKPQVSAELAWQAVEKIRERITYSKKDRSE